MHPHIVDCEHVEIPGPDHDGQQKIHCRMTDSVVHDTYCNFYIIKNTSKISHGIDAHVPLVEVQVVHAAHEDPSVLCGDDAHSGKGAHQEDDGDAHVLV